MKFYRFVKDIRYRRLLNTNYSVYIRYIKWTYIMMIIILKKRLINNTYQFLVLLYIMSDIYVLFVMDFNIVLSWVLRPTQGRQTKGRQTQHREELTEIN